MTTAATAAPPAPPPRRDMVTFWDIVWSQFGKNRAAVTSLWCLLVLVLVATAAPLIAMNMPFLLVRTAAEEGVRSVEWPLFERLFDERIYPGGIDIFFNLLLLLGPLWWTVSRLLPALGVDGSAPDRRRAAWLAAPVVLIVGFYAYLAFLPRGVFGRVLGIVAVCTAFQALQSWRGRGQAPRVRRTLRTQTRAGLLVIFAISFFVTYTYWRQGGAVGDYKAEIERLEASGQGWAVSPPVFFHPDGTGDPSADREARQLKPPTLKAGHLLGTDNTSRDVFTRILYGTRLSLTIGIVAVSIYATIGTILGSIAGYFGGWVDLLIVGILQVMVCIPTMFLLLTIIALFDTRSIFMVMVAIGVTSWPGITRLVRGEFFRQRNVDYVTAAKALGIPERRIIFGHILKNAMAPVLVAAAFGVAGAILAESGLSFLGLGDANAPSWGQILREGRTQNKNWLILSPGAAIFFVVTVLNLVGDGLRDALDPKLRK